MTDSEDVLLIENDGGLRILTLNRPAKLNAFNVELWDALRDALFAADGDETVACVLLTGRGRAFTSGVDLGDLADPAASGAGVDNGYVGFMPALEAFSKPLVAAVNGIGVGIGLTILPFCDLVYIDEEARLKTPFVELGVTTEAAASVMLPQRVGWQNAAKIIFTSAWIDADEAVRMGLAIERCPAGTALARAREVAAQISTGSVDSLQTSKRLMIHERTPVVRRARERELEQFSRMVGSAVNQAALDAFMGKQ